MDLISRLITIVKGSKFATGSIVAVFIVLLFPPWGMRIPQGFNVHLGVSFIFSPPNQIAEIDIGRLIIYVLLAAIVGGFIGSMVRNRKASRVDDDT
jgi:hypothetical protein